MNTRLRWAQVPDRMRAQFTAWAGAEVVSEISQPGGFSPGVASRLRLQDGRRVFVKAVSGQRNAMALDLHRREAQVLGYLPASAPTPRLLRCFDDGEWVVLVIEDVDGVPPRFPWRADELDRVMGALEQMAAALTPAPPVAVAIQDALGGAFTGWRSFAEAGGVAPELGEWASAHLDELVELESNWAEAARGNTLLHVDLRDDNLLLDAQGRVVVVDWPHAAMGAAWVDALGLLPSVAMGATVDPQEVWARFGPAQAAEPQAVDAVLAALTGYFLFGSLQPAPRNMPTVRAFQRAQGDAALAWLRRRLG